MNQFNRVRFSNNQELVDYLKDKGIIKSQKVYEIMSKVDRKDFVNDYNPYNDAYIDAPQSIGHGRTISAPHMCGAVLESFADKLTDGNRALIIRCSSGYLTTCMALMLESNGSVVHVESVKDIQEKVRKNIKNNYEDLLSRDRIEFNLGNEIYGYPSKAPYDIIYVGAALINIPHTFLNQLAKGGRLIMPVVLKDDVQVLTQVNKISDRKLQQTKLMNVKYGYLNLEVECEPFGKLFTTEGTILQTVHQTENIVQQSASVVKSEKKLPSDEGEQTERNTIIEENVQFGCLQDLISQQECNPKSLFYKAQNNTLKNQNAILEKHNDSIIQDNVKFDCLNNSNPEFKNKPFNDNFKTEMDIFKTDEGERISLVKSEKKLTSDDRKQIERNSIREKNFKFECLKTSDSNDTINSDQSTINLKLENKIQSYTMDGKVNETTSLTNNGNMIEEKRIKILPSEIIKIIILREQLDNLKEALKNNAVQQHLILDNMKNKLQSKIAKWGKRTDDRIDKAMEKGLKILERKSCIKEEKINNKAVECDTQIQNSYTAVLLEIEILKIEIKNVLDDKCSTMFTRMSEFEDKFCERLQMLDNRICKCEKELLSLNEKLESKKVDEWTMLKQFVKRHRILAISLITVLPVTYIISKKI